jgi:hypothetical protein
VVLAAVLNGMVSMIWFLSRYLNMHRLILVDY